VTPDGRERCRCRPLSEKLMRDEPWDEGIKETNSLQYL
jgi:hypothetical protein